MPTHALWVKSTKDRWTRVALCFWHTPCCSSLEMVFPIGVNPNKQACRDFRQQKRKGEVR